MVTNMRSSHPDRDARLPQVRQQLLENAVSDFVKEPDVLAVYLGGSIVIDHGLGYGGKQSARRVVSYRREERSPEQEASRVACQLVLFERKS